MAWVWVGLTPCAAGWAREPCTHSSRSLGSPTGVHPPVEAQPVTLEDAGELGPSMLQAAQEVILVEGADLGRSLRQRPGEPWCQAGAASQALCVPGPAPRTPPRHAPGPPRCWRRSPVLPHFLALQGGSGRRGDGLEPIFPPRPSLLQTWDSSPPAWPLPHCPTWTRTPTFQGVMLFCRGMRLAM